eukprot:gene2972-5831_t
MFFLLFFFFVQFKENLSTATGGRERQYHMFHPLALDLIDPTTSSSSSSKSTTSSRFVPAQTFRASVDVSLFNAHPPKIIIAGAPASGKGTQCEKIKEEFDVVHLSTGDILRVAIKSGSELGRLAQNYVENGELVPDELVIGLVKHRLEDTDCQTKGWLLDGFPRTQAQAEALIDAQLIPDVFILLEVPDSILLERVTGRRSDPVTGKIYHMKFNPPSDPAIISRLVQRNDDTALNIQHRIIEFNQHINAVKSFFEDRITSVDGTNTPENVSTEVISAIHSHIFHTSIITSTSTVVNESNAVCHENQAKLQNV